MTQTGAMTRMFVAVLPPPEVVESLEELVAPRREAPVAGRPLRWSPPEQWHLTLAFAAQVPAHAEEQLVALLAEATAHKPGFATRLAGGGAFPDAATGRVLWAGVEDPAPYAALSVVARHAVARAGAEVDGQRLRPHVTLARSNRPVEMTRWLRVLETYRSPAWVVDHLALVASHLGEGPRGRPRHEVVAALPLGGGQRPRS